MDLFKDTIDNAVNQFDGVMKERIDQIDKMLENRVSQFQEMLNGVKITVNLEMPIVKKAEPA